MKDSGSGYPVIAIYLKGRELRPDDISKELGVTPTDSHQRGDQISQRAIPAKIGVWKLKADATIPSVSARIEDLLSKVGARKLVLKSLDSVEEAFFDVFYPLDPEKNENDFFEFGFQNFHLEKIAELGLELKVSVY